MNFSESDDIKQWDSDHTALVHVLWRDGITGAEADKLAAKIMQSEWMRDAAPSAQPDRESGR